MIDFPISVVGERRGGPRGEEGAIGGLAGVTQGSGSGGAWREALHAGKLVGVWRPPRGGIGDAAAPLEDEGKSGEGEGEEGEEEEELGGEGLLVGGGGRWLGAEGGVKAGHER